MLTADRGDLSPEVRNPGPERLSIAWLGRRYDWLDLVGAQTAFDDVDLIFSSASRDGPVLLSALATLPDLFHLAGSRPDALPKLRAAAPASAIVLDLSHGEPSGRVAGRLLARQGAAADLIVVGSALELREARWRYPHVAKRIVRLERPLDLERHAPPAELRSRGGAFDRFRRAKALETPALLFAGPFAARGGLDAAIVAAASLAPEIPDLTLVAIREDEVNARYVKRCLRHAKELGLRVIVEDAPRPDELPFWYAAASAVCLPSRDGAGAEPARLAAAAGRPIVGNEVESLLEQVVDGETGVLVPVDDNRALVEAVSAVLMNDAEAHRLGEGARRQIEAEASPATGGARLRRLWETAVRLRRAAGGGTNGRR